MLHGDKIGRRQALEAGRALPDAPKNFGASAAANGPTVGGCGVFTAWLRRRRRSRSPDLIAAEPRMLGKRARLGNPVGRVDLRQNANPLKVGFALRGPASSCRDVAASELWQTYGLYRMLVRE